MSERTKEIQMLSTKCTDVNDGRGVDQIDQIRSTEPEKVGVRASSL